MNCRFLEGVTLGGTVQEWNLCWDHVPPWDHPLKQNSASSLESLQWLEVKIHKEDISGTWILTKDICMLLLQVGCIILSFLWNALLVRRNKYEQLTWISISILWKLSKNENILFRFKFSILTLQSRVFTVYQQSPPN